VSFGFGSEDLGFRALDLGFVDQRVFGFGVLGFGFLGLGT
jgi:hypothetical protein